jgi:RNA polymerase sigma factor (sigma-70 family)
MSGYERDSDAAIDPGRDFRTTHWSVVLAAGNGCSTHEQAALETLCRVYWHPIYAYFRRRGHDPHDAQDLTQDFFASILARQDLTHVHPAKGKFRTFLLTCAQNFLANEWRKTQTLKRGGGQTAIPLDTVEAEQTLAADLTSQMTPERLFDRRWAATILQQAVENLRGELVAEDKATTFDELNVYLTQPPGSGGYDAVAERLGMTPGAVATRVHRMRHRYRELVRSTLANTVTTPLELEEEMRYLLEVCG